MYRTLRGGLDDAATALSPRRIGKATPHGVDEFDAAKAGTRTINYTEDVGGGSPGVFTGALQSRAIGGFVDVFASTQPRQAIEVSGSGLTP